MIDPQQRARWVAQVFRAAVANVARQVCQSDTVAAVFDVRTFILK